MDARIFQPRSGFVQHGAQEGRRKSAAPLNFTLGVIRNECEPRSRVAGDCQQFSCTGALRGHLSEAGRGADCRARGIDGRWTTITTSARITEDVLHAVFHALHQQRVVLEYMILKPNMVVSVRVCAEQATPQQVAQATLTCLRSAMPAAVPGIVFLSGGRTRQPPPLTCMP